MPGRIVKVSGPLIVAEGMQDVKVYDVVRVSEQRLIGEVIELRGDRASVQVYEETSGLGPGEPVYTTGEALSVELAPGLIEAIFDGIQRPLVAIRKSAGDRIARGIEVSPLDREKLWDFKPSVKNGDHVSGGDVLGTVQETKVVEHRIMVPPGIEGEVTWIFSGQATIVAPIAKISTQKGEVELPMIQKWPVRIGRPYKKQVVSGAADGHGAARHRYILPGRKGRGCSGPGPVRQRQDRRAAPACQVG